MDHLTLPSGARMPVIGLGTYEQLPKGAGRRRLEDDGIARGLRLGYRHIDSAVYYGNHESIPRALAEAGVPRTEVFLTTKVYRDKLTYDDVLSECERILTELQTDYLDLYLAHWPNDDMPMAETFRGMARLLDEGLVRDMGVANFTRANLRQALDASPAPIAMNQVEFHPLLYQARLLEFCHEHDVHVTAYAPIAQGQVLAEPVLQQVGAAHGKSPVQVSLRWILQKGLVAVPKASSDEHLLANLDLFDWSLTAAEVEAIDAIGRKVRIFDWEAVAAFSTDD